MGKDRSEAQGKENLFGGGIGMIGESGLESKKGAKARLLRDWPLTG